MKAGQHRQAHLAGSYSHYYRRMLAPLLETLDFRCNNSAYRPVMDAIDLLGRYAGIDSGQKFYTRQEKVPIDGVVPRAMAGNRISRVDDF